MAIRTPALANFLQSVLAAAGNTPIAADVVMQNVTVDESCNVRADLSDGSHLILEIVHMVPRDYFKNEIAA